MPCSYKDAFSVPQGRTFQAPVSRLPILRRTLLEVTRAFLSLGRTFLLPSRNFRMLVVPAILVGGTGIFHSRTFLTRDQAL